MKPRQARHVYRHNLFRASAAVGTEEHRNGLRVRGEFRKHIGSGERRQTQLDIVIIDQIALPLGYGDFAAIDEHDRADRG